MALVFLWWVSTKEKDEIRVRGPPKARGKDDIISYNRDRELRQRCQGLDTNLHLKSEENGGVGMF